MHANHQQINDALWENALGLESRFEKLSHASTKLFLTIESYNGALCFHLLQQLIIVHNTQFSLFYLLLNMIQSFKYHNNIIP